VTGKIKNNASTTLVAPGVCVVVRDASNAVLITNSDVLDDAAQNATKTFSVTIKVPDDDTADSVDIWVDGLNGSASGAPVRPESALSNAIGVCAATTTASATSTVTTTSTSSATATDTVTATATATGTTTPAATNTPVPSSTPC
jgi:hypothetical protein